MSRPTSELAHLFRELKAPAAAAALGKLAERARAEEWNYEQFLANTALHLGQLDFLAGKENVILLGPPGTGKLVHCKQRSGRRGRLPPGPTAPSPAVHVSGGALPRHSRGGGAAGDG